MNTSCVSDIQKDVSHYLPQSVKRACPITNVDQLLELLFFFAFAVKLKPSVAIKQTIPVNWTHVGNVDGMPKTEQPASGVSHKGAGCGEGRSFI